MSIIAPVDEDGKIITQFNVDENEKEKANSNSTLGKEAFLQLLVAQMQYQDPLEPMDNTEYVSQLATFSQLEALQNMESTLSGGQATDLVGKTVMVKVTDSNGDTNLKAGVVDYVVFEGGTPYLVINEEKYPYTDLDTVVSDDYLSKMENSNLVNAFVSYMDDLPDPLEADLSVSNKVAIAQEAYDSLTEEQKAMVGEDYVKKLNELVALMKKLSELASGSGSTEGGGSTEGSGSTEGGNTESGGSEGSEA